MSSKVNSIEERVKLPPTDTISRCYQTQQGNRKLIRILTVVVYVLCVSLAAIMLSLYYIFIWDPTIRPFITKTGQCEKIIIPEKIAIRLLNSSEVTAEQFYRHILEQYRILYQLQIQRQQFLQKQHIQLQQLAAGNRFQEIFATATILQAPVNERLKPLTPTNGTFLLEAPLFMQPQQQQQQQQQQINEQEQNQQQQQKLIGQLPISDAQQTNINTHGKRKSHRKHYNNNNNNNFNNNNNNISNSSNHRTHRRNSHKIHNYNNHNNNNNNNINNKILINKLPAGSESNLYNNNDNKMHEKEDNTFLRPDLNEPILLVEENNTPATLIIPEAYTSIPIPLILNSSEDNKSNNNNDKNNNKRRSYGERRVNMALGKRRTTTPTYMNPLLTGELIFEK